MKRVDLSHGLNGVFLIVFGFFAVGVLLIGALLVFGAERIAAAPAVGGSAVPWYVTGAVALCIGAVMMRTTTRGVGAVARIDVLERDGQVGWILYTRFGRELMKVGPDSSRRLELRGARIFILAAAVPKSQDVVEGTLVIDDEHRFRVAVSGPHTWDHALAELGYDVRAPRPGESKTI